MEYFRLVLVCGFRSVWRIATPPGQDTNPSQVNPQQMLVLMFTEGLNGTSQGKCFVQGHNIVLRPWFELTTITCKLTT